ncbi:Hsp20 family protein [soil metagenome]
MFDLTPLYRSTVGYDRLASLLDNVASFETPAYPPYNIERLGENAYRVTMAVAGFGAEDIAIEVKQNTLTVTGKKAEKTEQKVEFLHQGIAQRGFERRFQLADFVQVDGAEMDNGLLHISLKREIPEAMKPRTIAIKGAKQPQTIENRKAA